MQHVAEPGFWDLFGLFAASGPAVSSVTTAVSLARGAVPLRAAATKSMVESHGRRCSAYGRGKPLIRDPESLLTLVRCHNQSPLNPITDDGSKRVLCLSQGSDASANWATQRHSVP